MIVKGIKNVANINKLPLNTIYTNSCVHFGFQLITVTAILYSHMAETLFIVKKKKTKKTTPSKKKKINANLIQKLLRSYNCTEEQPKTVFFICSLRVYVQCDVLQHHNCHLTV